MQKYVRSGLLALALALPGWLPGQTCYVSPSGGHLDPFDSWAKASTNIQTALRTAATNGWSTVLVATGTYNLAAQVAVTNALILRSWNNGSLDPENTILDGGGTVRCLFVSNASARVEGFTLTRGAGNITTPGAGAMMYYGLLTNCIIRGNGATNMNVWGGGAYLYNDSAIKNSAIIANACGTNVGAAGVGLAGSSIVANCVIAFNTNVRFGANVSYGGGGVRLTDNARIENCQIISNVSGSYGPGIFAAPSANRTNIIRNCLIAGNSNAHNFGGAGIAMVASGIDRVTLVQNCTIVSNYSATYGGGIYVRYFSGNIIENSIVYYNGNISVQKDFYNDVAAGGTSWWTNCCTSRTNDFAGSGNTTNAPVFVDFDGGNYRLPEDSFLVNAGMNQGWMAGALDLDGHRRVDRMSGLADVGCYEYVYRGMLIGIR